MRTMRNGLQAGALAGLLLVALLFFDDGPSSQLMLVAQSLGLDGHGWSRALAALIVLILGAIIGGAFGALLRQPSLSRGWALLWGVVAGALWWVILYVILGAGVQHLTFSLFAMMLYFVLSLVYGLALGSIFTTMQQSRRSSTP